MWALLQKLLHVRNKWLNAAWLAATIVFATYAGFIRPSRAFRGVAEQRATALAAIERNRHWLIPVPESVDDSMLAEGVVGGVPGGLQQGMMGYLSSSEELADRKLVRTSSVNLLVQHPAESAEKIRSLAERLGGFLLKSETNGARDATNASLTICVPATHFLEASAEIRKLGLRVESEQMEAQDRTKQFVDQQAHLRNLRAQEAQYLGILKRATSVKDTLDVSERLNGVRGQIEQQQAEFESLSRQVDTVAITVLLRSEAQANLFGLHWRPCYELKLAMMQGLESLADYVSAMFSLIFYLPAILLWLATVLVGTALCWKIIRVAVRMLFTKRVVHASA
jgi:hypothetical protein